MSPPANRPDPAAPERAVIIASLPHGEDGRELLLEMEELLLTAQVVPVATLTQHRDGPHPSTYLGPGKLDELKALVSRLGAEVVVCDDELTPRQQRRLEDELQSRVVDRTAVILDIFAQHAHTAEGKLQVELAQLEYNLQRMRGSGSIWSVWAAASGRGAPVRRSSSPTAAWPGAALPWSARRLQMLPPVER